ncbi:hypothetical protein BOW53_14125 [Solemya pervernicosa gill symbiont]|uniref:DUF2059 domain-containing protein n=1 Tax=Solemya pervernicosa gill symbiont TaxID=642797 RepID=A0A1T2L0Z1_9GAMM|nr:hypothetical protein [Solemya pervernicosa gill symbiont]OOZ38783.1 hypothetical protein BOW53_14125 [Solemya pervernicosa gill symbiont]
MKTIFIGFAFLFVISTSVCSADKDDIKTALELMDVINIERDINDDIESTLSVMRDQMIDVLPNKEDYIDYWIDGYRRMLNQEFDWESNRGKVAEMIANTYSQQEMSSYVEFFKAGNGRGYFSKKGEFDEKLDVWIKGKVGGLEARLEELTKSAAKKYDLKLKERKPKTMEEIASEDYYDIRAYKCHWPIPNDLMLSVDKFDRYLFVNNKVGLLEGYKLIIIEKVRDTIESEFEEEARYAVQKLGDRKGFEFYSISSINDNGDVGGAPAFAVEKGGVRVFMVGVDVIELDYMLARCDATKKEY